MSEVTVYEKTSCSKCRALVELLEEQGVSFDRVDFHLDPLTASEIRDLLRIADLGPREVLRESESAYAELRLAERDLSDEELIDLIAAHPELLQRPIVVRGDKAVLARPAERVLALF